MNQNNNWKFLFYGYCKKENKLFKLSISEGRVGIKNNWDNGYIETYKPYLKLDYMKSIKVIKTEYQEMVESYLPSQVIASFQNDKDIIMNRRLICLLEDVSKHKMMLELVK